MRKCDADTAIHVNIDEQVSGAASQESRFFVKLSHDVRLLIYDYLYEWLPPLAYKEHWDGFVVNDCRGLILSCQQANKELSAAAGRHLKIYLTEFTTAFEKHHGAPISLCGGIPLYSGWAALRCITLSLDVNFFEDEFYKEEWRQATKLDGYHGQFSCPRSPWRNLLERPFDKVTLLVTDANVPPDDDSDDDRNAMLVKFINLLRNNLEGLAEHIGSDWLAFQDALDLATAYEYERKPELVYPHEHTWGCEHECDSSCDYHIECGHLDECGSNCDEDCQGRCDYHIECGHLDECGSNCDEDCQGRCEGECECDWEGDFVSDCHIEFDCKYAGDEETYGFEADGPKGRNYDSDEQFRFARVQWKRLCDRGSKCAIDKRYFRGNDEGLERRRIQTKQISFAWNFLPGTEKFPEKLQGHKYRYNQKHVRDLCRKDGMSYHEDYEKLWPHRYEVSAHGGMIGEMGIAHPNLWRLASEECTDYYGLIYHLSKEEAEVLEVESEGIGMPVVEAETEASDEV